MDTLSHPDTLVIFTTSPSGLGHIRVMDALKEGLAPKVKSIEIGLRNVSASKIHALGSRLPLFSKFTEFYQTNKIAEAIVSKILLTQLIRNKKQVFDEFSIVDHDYPDKKLWIIVSTHFALAHTIAPIRAELESLFNKKIVLSVVMSDDSPQRVWAVPKADIIFIPSQLTRDNLIQFFADSVTPQLKVISFPVSPRLTQKLSSEEFSLLQQQVDPGQKHPLHIEIPVSGAAVQLPYIITLIDNLSEEKVRFTVIGQETVYSKNFFEKIKRYPKIQMSIGVSARQTVDLYESLFYQLVRPAIEITKPSEQTFKALIKPTERGGVILLLTEPIGRQEKDNLNFLIRHRLLPDNLFQQKLEANLIEKNALPKKEEHEWLYNASHWRAIRLPSDPQKAALFIKYLRTSGIFSAMLSYVAEDLDELTSNGVSQIWDSISEYAKKLIPTSNT